MSIVNKELERSIKLPEHERFVRFILVASELEAHCDALRGGTEDDRREARLAWDQFRQERTR